MTLQLGRSVMYLLVVVSGEVGEPWLLMVYGCFVVKCESLYNPHNLRTNGFVDFDGFVSS